MFLLLKRNNNFGDNKVWKKEKKFLHPFLLKNGRVCGKITKNYVFPTLGQKNTNLVLINTQKLDVHDF